MIHLPKRVTFKSNSIWAFYEGLEQGYGIGLLPLNAADSRTRHLVRIMPECEHSEALYLVAHQDLKRSARIRAVFDYLVEAFRQDSAFFSEGGESVFSPGKPGMAPPSSVRESRKQSALSLAAE
ncbi:MAG: LysR substrate-binding domain-containing protein, partial [Litorimonas sp.]